MASTESVTCYETPRGTLPLERCNTYYVIYNVRLISFIVILYIRVRFVSISMSVNNVSNAYINIIRVMVFTNYVYATLTH